MYISNLPVLVLSAWSFCVDACTGTVCVGHIYGGFFTASLHDVPGGLYHACALVTMLHLSLPVMYRRAAFFQDGSLVEVCVPSTFRCR